MCAEPAAGIADSTMRAIERAAQPAEQQRAGLEALRLRSAAMAQLIASSCPTHPLRGYMGRFAAVTDRLDVMLFAVMTMAPVLQQFYDSLRRQISTGRFPPVTLPSGHRDKHEAADRRSRCRHPVALRFSAGPEIISSQRWFFCKTTRVLVAATPFCERRPWSRADANAAARAAVFYDAPGCATPLQPVARFEQVRTGSPAILNARLTIDGPLFFQNKH